MTNSSATARQLGSGCAQPLLALENVNKSFGDLHVLRAVNLSMERGEVLVVVGPSGGGKSTLCRTINRLEPIDSGRIVFDGRPLPAEGRELARHRADVGMVALSGAATGLERRSRHRRITAVPAAADAELVAERT